jgi:hypothetical protein
VVPYLFSLFFLSTKDRASGCKREEERKEGEASFIYCSWGVLRIEEGMRQARRQEVVESLRTHRLGSRQNYELYTTVAYPINLAYYVQLAQTRREYGKV